MKYDARLRSNQACAAAPLISHLKFTRNFRIGFIGAALCVRLPAVRPRCLGVGEKMDSEIDQSGYLAAVLKKTCHSRQQKRNKKRRPGGW